MVQFSWKRSGAVRGREQDARRQQHCFGSDGGLRTIHSSWALVKGLYEGPRYTRCVLNCTPSAGLGEPDPPQFDHTRVTRLFKTMLFFRCQVLLSYHRIDWGPGLVPCEWVPIMNRRTDGYDQDGLLVSSETALSVVPNNLANRVGF